MVGAFAFLAAAAVVKASSFGFDATNATRALQAALDSGARRVVVDRQAYDWIVDPLKVNSNTEIFFEDGVTVRARAGSFTNVHDVLFLARNVRNVSFTGNGSAALAMNRDDYRDARRYAKSEFRHAIALEGAANARVADLVIRGAGGDGVYLDNVVDCVVERVTVIDSIRQGSSVVSCRNLLFRDCIFMSTAGMPPQAGIDVEPDGARDAVENLRVENCDFIGNAGHGLEFHLSQLNHNSRPVSVFVSNCRFRGNRNAGLSFHSGGYAPVPGKVEFSGCRSAGNAGPALRLRNHVAGGIATSFRNCVFDGCGSTSAVVQVHNSMVRPFGGIALDGVKIVADGACEPFCFTCRDGVGATDVTGGVYLERNGETTFRPASDFLAANRPSGVYAPFSTPIKRNSDYRFRPVNPAARGKMRPSPFYWGAGTFFQYVPKAGVYPIVLRKSLAGAGKVPVIRVAVKNPHGDDFDSFSTRGFEDFEYRLEAKEAGTYSFVFSAYEFGVAFESPFPGQGMLADVAARCWKTRLSKDIKHIYYFRVKASASEVAVLLGSHCSKISAELLRPDGSVAASGTAALGEHLPLRAPRPSAGKEETWAIRYGEIEPRSDITLGAGCVPVVSHDPDLLLTEF